MTEPWKTSIEFTVTPTDDPDVVNVADGGFAFPVGREYTANENDAYAQAGRAYFEAHPAHPLAGAKVGEWWMLTYDDSAIEYIHRIEEGDVEIEWKGLVSARPVYVIPKAEADLKATTDHLIGHSMVDVYYARAVKEALELAL